MIKMINPHSQWAAIVVKMVETNIFGVGPVAVTMYVYATRRNSISGLVPLTFPAYIAAFKTHDRYYHDAAALRFHGKNKETKLCHAPSYIRYFFPRRNMIQELRGTQCMRTSHTWYSMMWHEQRIVHRYARTFAKLTIEMTTLILQLYFRGHVPPRRMAT